MFKIIELKDEKVWENFLKKKEIDFFPFFQSWDWGEVQKKSGFDILRFGIFDKHAELAGVFLIVDINARRGHYLHMRHGPVLSSFKDKCFDAIINFVKEIAKERNTSFIRISPLIKNEDIKDDFFKKRGFINAPVHNMDAQNCWILDITKPEDQLLKEMRKTHRYLIRKAQTMDIKIIRSKNLSYLDSFLNLYNDLSKRKGFVPHRGIREEFEILSKNDEAILIMAEYEKKIISAALIVFTGDMAIYHHGVSADEYKNIPASYLIQWEAIKEAKNRGKKIYNFWGIVPIDEPNHPWKGITLFKTGFGGERRDFIHAKDLPLNIWYWKSYLIEYIAKIKKGY
ncbi:MAG: peptidoglycan bridge formation glycyltransferase FemA/FemB family protein [Candidatus Levybacteria bacterium]|nr:peptidoglycan bridge formation glycyltransferase FemA/FemB family protein [Candidatus Levybacteria bacterium]